MYRFILYFFVLLGITACSSDDNSNTQTKEKQLAITVNKNEINEGEYVKFAITLDGEIEKGSELFIGDFRIYTPHRFDEKGTYHIIARKKGCRESKPIEVTVNAALGTSLVLSTENTNIKLGDKVNFIVQDNKGYPVENVQIFNKLTGIALDGFDFTVDKIANYVFIAKAPGYQDSQELTIEIKPLFKINNKEYPLDLLSVSIEMEYIKNVNGDTKLVDKVYFLEDGTLANQYEYVLINIQGEDYNLLSFIIYVENTSIVVDNGEIINYGKRILPNLKTKIELAEIFALTETDYFIEDNEGIYGDVLGQYSIKVPECKIPNNGIGAEKNGVTGKGGLYVEYKSKSNSVDIDFNGEFMFSEKLPKDAKKIKVKGKDIDLLRKKIK